MLGQDLIQYIIENHYSCDNLEEALNLRLVSKRMSKVIPSKPTSKHLFWIRYFETKEQSKNIPVGSWRRIHTYLNVDLERLVLYLEYGFFTHTFEPYNVIYDNSTTLTNNNYIISHNTFTITSPSQDKIKYNCFDNHQRNDHEHFCMDNLNNIVACVYKGTLSLECTVLWITPKHLRENMDIRPGPRYRSIFEYMYYAKKHKLIYPNSIEGELEYLQQHLHEI